MAFCLLKQNNEIELFVLLTAANHTGYFVFKIHSPKEHKS